MLTKEPKDRLTAAEAYNDPWIQKNAPTSTIDVKAIKNLSSFFVTIVLNKRAKIKLELH